MSERQGWTCALLVHASLLPAPGQCLQAFGTAVSRPAPCGGRPRLCKSLDLDMATVS